MKKPFRVLLIDDDEQLVADLRKRISLNNRLWEGREYYLHLKAVHVHLEVQGDILTISDETFNQLDEACAKPFSLILADFGYFLRDVDSVLGDRPFKREELEGKVLTVADLAESADSYRSRGNSLQKNLIHSNAKFYLYSYISEKYYPAFGGMYERETIVKNAFKGARVESLDTRDIFFGETFRAKHEKEYYSHLVGRYLDRVIKQEFVEFILQDSKRVRSTRTKQLASVVGIGAIVGIAAEWIGARFFVFYEHGKWADGAIFGIAGLVILVAIGVAVSFFVEHLVLNANED